MSLRDEIERRLGVFARPRTFANCGIGAEGFQPGNNCGSEGAGGASTSKPSNRVQGIETRAKESGQSFTDQWLQETRSAIDKRYQDAERRRNRAQEQKKAKADSRVRELEKRLADLKAQGPRTSPRLQELERNIAATTARLAESKKAADAARAQAKTAADEARARSEQRNQEVLKKWTKMFGPKKAEEMLARVLKDAKRN